MRNPATWSTPRHISLLMCCSLCHSNLDFGSRSRSNIKSSLRSKFVILSPSFQDAGDQKDEIVAPDVDPERPTMSNSDHKSTVAIFFRERPTEQSTQHCSVEVGPALSLSFLWHTLWQPRLVASQCRIDFFFFSFLCLSGLQSNKNKRPRQPLLQFNVI